MTNNDYVCGEHLMNIWLFQQLAPGVAFLTITCLSFFIMNIGTVRALEKNGEPAQSLEQTTVELACQVQLANVIRQSVLLKKDEQEETRVPKLKYRLPGKMKRNEVNFAMFFNKNNHLVYTSYLHKPGPMRIVNEEGQELLSGFPKRGLKVQQFAVASNERFLATASNLGNFAIVNLWESRKRNPVAMFGMKQDRAVAVKVSPDQDRVVACGYYTKKNRLLEVTGWALPYRAKSEVLFRFETEIEDFKSLQNCRAADISTDTTKLAVVNQGGVDIWDLEKERRIIRIRNQDSKYSARSVRFSDDMKIVAWCVGDQVMVSSVETGELLKEYRCDADIFGISISQDAGQICVTTAISAFVFDVANDELLFQWELPVIDKRLAIKSAVKCMPWHVEISPNGYWLATAGYNTPLCVWELKK